MKTRRRLQSVELAISHLTAPVNDSVSGRSGASAGPPPAHAQTTDKHRREEPGAPARTKPQTNLMERRRGVSPAAASKLPSANISTEGTSHVALGKGQAVVADLSAPRSGSDAGAGGVYEVIREHPATCRVQLAAWPLPTQEDAERLASTLNDRMAADGGRTLAASGLRESGWVYRWREASR